MGIVELFVDVGHSQFFEGLGHDARPEVQVELVAGAAVDEDALEDEERNKIYYFEYAIKLIINIIINSIYKGLRKNLNNKNLI